MYVERFPGAANASALEIFWLFNLLPPAASGRGSFNFSSILPLPLPEGSLSALIFSH